MRLSIAMILALACTETDTPEQRFTDLVAKNEIDCGGVSVTVSSELCLDQAQAQDALDCMNNALTSGARAAFFSGSLDDDFFTEDTVMFTVDHQVIVYVDYPQGDGHHDSEYAVENPTCDGPFQLSPAGMCGTGGASFFLVLAGCP
jgi:hypothetical protein